MCSRNKCPTCTTDVFKVREENTTVLPTLRGLSVVQVRVTFFHSQRGNGGVLKTLSEINLTTPVRE